MIQTWIDAWNKLARAEERATPLGAYVALQRWLDRDRVLLEREPEWGDGHYPERRARLDALLIRLESRSRLTDFERAWNALWACKHVALLELERREWMRIEREVLRERDVAVRNFRTWLTRLRHIYQEALVGKFFGSPVSVSPWRPDDLSHDVLKLFSQVARILESDPFFSYRPEHPLRQAKSGWEKRSWLPALRKWLREAGCCVASPMTGLVALKMAEAVCAWSPAGRGCSVPAHLLGLGTERAG